jgi:hypothetical protein
MGLAWGGSILERGTSPKVLNALTIGDVIADRRLVDQVQENWFRDRRASDADTSRRPDGRDWHERG